MVGRQKSTSHRKDRNAALKLRWRLADGPTAESAWSRFSAMLSRFAASAAPFAASSILSEAPGGVELGQLGAPWSAVTNHWTPCRPPVAALGNLGLSPDCHRERTFDGSRLGHAKSRRVLPANVPAHHIRVSRGLAKVNFLHTRENGYSHRQGLTLKACSSRKTWARRSGWLCQLELAPAPHLGELHARPSPPRRGQNQDVTESARAVRARYAAMEDQRYGRRWTTEEIMLGFVGDVGDLAKLVQGKAGVRPTPAGRQGRARAGGLLVVRAHTGR